MTGCKRCGAPLKAQQRSFCSRACAAPVKGMNRTHGMSFTPTHNSWCDMRKRCGDPGHRAYRDYGGRGIKVCDRWNSFENFFEDMGTKPEGLSLDRIDNNGNYEPGNCKWSTRSEQMKNRRPRSQWRTKDRSVTGIHEQDHGAAK